MLLEFILPGAISFCIGLSFLFLAVLFHFQIVSDPFTLFFIWAGSSVFTSTVGLYISNKMFKGELEVDDYLDELDKYGNIAVAAENIDDNSGRIKYQGSTWKAISANFEIKKGAEVRLVSRIAATWIVEPVNIV